VRKIGPYAFRYCTNLASASVPESVTEIGENAFEGCTALTITCPHDSSVWKYCRKEKIKIKSSDSPGLLSFLFGKKDSKH
jgi:hypothetical protein